jgi:hypothetical protein
VPDGRACHSRADHPSYAPMRLWLTDHAAPGGRVVHEQETSTMARYLRFAAMILTSTTVMFGLTYLSTYAVDHVLFSEMRLYMAAIMGAAMAVVMLLFMLSMYDDRSANAVVVVTAAVVFGFALWLMRSQAAVDDIDYMEAMIPHHSITVLTSRRARITDPRVRELADEIIEAQLREIDEMKRLIADLRSDRT